MTPKEYQNNIIVIADHYGYDEQREQLYEEMAELIQAFNKLRRNCNKNGKDSFTNYPYLSEIFTEIADVEIMLEQIKYLMDCHDQVEQEKVRKIERELKRIASK